MDEDDETTSRGKINERTVGWIDLIC